MTNPLTMLSELRKFDPNSDPSEYLSTQLRQNWKAIEDALKKIGVTNANLESSISAINALGNGTSSYGPDVTTFSTSSTSFVASTHTLTINSTGRPIHICLQGVPITETPFSISTTSYCYMELRDGSGRVISNSAINVRTDSPWSVIDPSPSSGSITYTIYARQTAAGTFTISNARLIAVTI